MLLSFKSTGLLVSAAKTDMFITAGNSDEDDDNDHDIDDAKHGCPDIVGR